MNEELLAFYWKHQRFREANLCSTDGEPIQVLYPGLPNKDAGPDFLHARIRIGDTLWAGNVEIHIKASDWRKHGHQSDPVYDTVILHLVYEKDEELGLNCAELELRHFIDTQSLEVFRNWQNSVDAIPCSGLLAARPEAMTPFWLDRMLVERLEDKARRINRVLEECHGSWEAAFFLWMAHYFGLRVNVLPFECMARITPWSLVQKYRTRRNSLEALFFGQAGFLEGRAEDGYQYSMQQEYRLMQKMHNLDPQQASLWKFLRLRPSNFPGIRISQFAALFFSRERLLSSLLECEEVRSMEKILSVNAGEYWAGHTHFGRPGRTIPLRLGKETSELLLANAVLPFLFVYAHEQYLPDKKEQLLDMYHQLGSENNRVIRRWQSMGMKTATLGESQALMHLYTHYCEKKNCLHCEVGQRLLKVEETTLTGT